MNAIDNLKAAKAAAEAAASRAKQLREAVGNDGFFAREAAASEGEAVDVRQRGVLSGLWRNAEAAKAEALFHRMLPPEIIGAAAAAESTVSLAQSCFARETAAALAAAVSPEALGRAYAEGSRVDVDKVDAAAKAVNAINRFNGIKPKPPSRSEKSSRAAAWLADFRSAFLSREDELAAEAAEAEAVQAEALAEALAEAAAREVAKNNATAAKVAAKVAKLQTALAEALAERYQAEAAALAEALAKVNA
jgi:hypothetical protein